MPAFLEKKLKAEYGNNPHAIYGTMNKIGAMKGNKETAKGREMEKKHAMKFSHTTIDHLGDGSHVVTHHPVMKASKTGAMMHAPSDPVKYTAQHDELTSKLGEHLGLEEGDE